MMANIHDDHQPCIHDDGPPHSPLPASLSALLTIVTPTLPHAPKCLHKFSCEIVDWYQSHQCEEIYMLKLNSK